MSSLQAQQSSEVPRLEDKTIQPIPLNERHGRARDLFTIWFGSNIMVLTIVTGALGTSVFGLDVGTSIVAIVKFETLAGAIFMALRPRPGPPTRGAAKWSKLVGSSVPTAHCSW